MLEIKVISVEYTGKISCFVLAINCYSLGVGPVLSHPVPAATEAEFLGNGDWPRDFSSSQPPAPPTSIPPPPIEGVDAPRKQAYKMTSRPRGIGICVCVCVPVCILVRVHVHVNLSVCAHVCMCVVS